MNCEPCANETCINPNNNYVCKEAGNFYSTGEYSRTLEFFGIHGVSFKQKVDSVKMQLDYNTLQILKALLTDNEAPCELDYLTGLHVVQSLDFIQSRLSNDNKTKSSIPGDDL